MTRKRRKPVELGELVTLAPVAGRWIEGVAAIEQTVSREEAERLLAYSPPAFTVKETEAPAAGEETPS